MVGDEMGERVVAVQFRAAEKLTGAVLKKLFGKLLEGGAKLWYHATPNKMNIHKLAGDNGQTHGIEVTKEEMQGFDRYAKKYHVWYSLTREKNDKNQYMFMFKLKDFNRLESAMRDYFKDGREHAGLREKIEHAAQEALRVNEARAKNKVKEQVKSKVRNRGRVR
ncbi:MAG TPA: PcfB family protein [Caproicibacter sp.]|nr:PcfB family protein [Caproicibacter sp.]